MRYQEILEACWTGYQQQGMKRKGDRQVPNCVPVAEVKTGPEITSKELLFKAAAQAMLAAGQEGQALDYEQAIKQASKIYGIPYIPSELPRLLAQRAEIDRQLALLKQGKKVAKARRQAKLAPTPAGAEEYWKSHSLPTDRIKPPAKTLEEQLEEDLRKWFKEKWVRFGPDGKIRGDCARGSESEGKPKCLPQSKAHALGKKGRASAAAKKRREDPNPERRGAAKNVATKVREGAVKDLYTELGEKYHELAPKIEKYKDSYLAGELYDALEEIAAQHGAITEFRRMLNAARNRAHMEYDTNPGGFHNWFWFLPFEDEQLDEISNELISRYKQKAGQQASELDRQAFSGNDPQAQQKIARANKRFSGIVRATNKQFDKSQVKESLRPGEYYVATVTLDNGEVRKFKVTFDEGYVDAIKNFYARQGRTVKDIDMDWSVQGDFYESGKDKSGSSMYQQQEVYMVVHDGKEVAFYKPGNMKQAYQDAEELVKKFGGEAYVRKVMRETKALDEKQDACYHKVKSRYKVWPSAYASGALVQCRKKGAANWGTGGKKK